MKQHLTFRRPASASTASTAHIPRLRQAILCAALLMGTAAGTAGAAPAATTSLGASHAPTNIIVMINDGAGVGTWDATAYWQYGSSEGTPYADFPQRMGVTTYPLNSSGQATRDNAQTISYSPERAWDATPVEATDLPFAGYQYLAAVATDSAAAGTALSSGTKTYNSAINYDNDGAPVEYNTLRAKRLGMATGVVTSVPFSHATPAAFAAQNASRNNYHAIAHQMLSQGHLDLVMGTGAPGFSTSGLSCTPALAGAAAEGCDTPWEFMGEEDWTALQAGRVIGGNPAGAWTLIRTRADFARLADGDRLATGPLIGIPQVARTLQQARVHGVVGEDGAQPSGTRQIDTVPDLAMMTKGALAHLAQRSDKGLFLMVEGGATDWSAHTSACGTEWDYGDCSEPQYGRLIEETVDFNNAVAEVVRWIDANGGWEHNLLIVTTDHDNSMPMGPEADRVAFAPVSNNGKGRMPGISFRPTGNHTNALVPLWAKGKGAERFKAHVRGTDPGFATHVGMNDGSYIDNTDVAKVVQAALEARAAAK